MSKLQVASFWLKQGFLLAPCQPDSKMLVKGFGVHQGKIKTTGEASRFWGSEASRANIAVIGWEGSIVLDFDSSAVYASWRDQHPNESRSYTETTPRGGYHVFMRGLAPRGLTFREGVELKQVVLVYPSTVNGKQYHQGEGAILDVDSAVALSGLTVPGMRTAYAQIANTERERKMPEYLYPGSTVSRIKQGYTVTQVILDLKPGITLQGHGRYITAKCPFHDDAKPSFWIDQELNLFGCHACKETGDVINLYAKLKGITNSEAIRIMARGLP